jgi:hypothetical protein
VINIIAKISIQVNEKPCGTTEINFQELDTTKEYNGYFCSVAEAVTIIILGSICGLKNTSQIHNGRYRR